LAMDLEKKIKNGIAKIWLAFNQPLTAETIFQAAKRQEEKKVLAINAVRVDIDNSRMSDLMHMYPKIIEPSLIIDLEVTVSIIWRYWYVYKA
jgi:tRNA(Ile)-lysidine synthase TilS/MesJ